MEMIHSHTSQIIIRYVNVADGPILPHPKSVTGKKFRLASFAMTFMLTGDVWKPTRLAARGPVLKADRSDSRVEFDDQVIAWELMAAWEFMHGVADRIRPRHSAELPFAQLPGEYFYCGATNDPPGGETFTCNRRVAHKGKCSPKRDVD